MITIRTTIGDAVMRLSSRILLMGNKERIVRSCAVQLSGELRRRIHVDGLDAQGNAIGVYSASYLKMRQRKYNRTSDPKVIFSLTSEMENDMGAVETSRGYGIGFKNPINVQKAEWLEERFSKSESENRVYALSTNEQTTMGIIIHDEIENIAAEHV